ncbi:MAG: isochorismatase family protein [Gammaproteobacteria bacterium]|nr:isochorismatase family protein [Gammaproteobacteria bacterium]
MLIQAERSLLLLIDIQEGVINFIHHHEQLLANCTELLMMAKAFNVPVLASEHMPERMGHTIELLRQRMSPDNCFAKTEFSSLAAAYKPIKASKRKQIILAGLETHLCVLQTALELIDKKYQVYVVADATNSRFPEDKAIALQRLQQCGVQIISKQMLLFEWARDGKNPAYKALSKQLLK